MDDRKLVGRYDISVPYKGAGGVVRHHAVTFAVYQAGESFAAVPDLSTDERRLANLPEELLFGHIDGKAVSHRGKMDGNQHVIDALFEHIKAQK